MTVDFPDCPTCDGTGERHLYPLVKCPVCDGLGVLLPDEMVAVAYEALRARIYPDSFARPKLDAVKDVIRTDAATVLAALVRWQQEMK